MKAIKRWWWRQKARASLRKKNRKTYAEVAFFARFDKVHEKALSILRRGEYLRYLRHQSRLSLILCKRLKTTRPSDRFLNRTLPRVAALLARQAMK